MRLLLALILSIIHLSTIGQVLIKGTIQNETGHILPGCEISELNTTNMVLSDMNGQFSINLKNDSSLIEISYIGCFPLKVRVDSINHESFHAVLTNKFLDAVLDEIVLIAPNPPYLEIGYKGLIPHQPFGLHIEYSKWGDKFRSYLDISTSDLKNYFYSFEIGPYRFGKSKFHKVLNLNLKGFFLQNNSDILFCNQFYIAGWALNVGIGNGKRELSHNRQVFLTGIEKSIELPLPPFLTNYLGAEFVYNREHFDWTCFLYTEIYNKSYRNLSFGVGYQNFYSQKDLALNINYKYYFLKK